MRKYSDIPAPIRDYVGWAT